MKKIILLFLLLLWAQLVFSYYRPPYYRPRYPQYHDYYRPEPPQYLYTVEEIPEKIPFDKLISSPVLLRILELDWQNNLFKISIYDKYDVYSGEHIEQGISIGVKF